MRQDPSFTREIQPLMIHEMSNELPTSTRNTSRLADEHNLSNFMSDGYSAPRKKTPKSFSLSGIQNHRPTTCVSLCISVCVWKCLVHSTWLPDVCCWSRRGFSRSSLLVSRGICRNDGEVVTYLRGTHSQLTFHSCRRHPTNRQNHAKKR